jgi:hypothetical protein
MYFLHKSTSPNLQILPNSPNKTDNIFAKIYTFATTFGEKSETCLTKFGQVMSKSGEYCVNGHNLGKTL